MAAQRLDPATLERAFRVAVVALGVLPWALVGQPEGFWHTIFAPLCHQRPERTLQVLGEPMVVCSRCAGLYPGFALGALLPWRQAWLDHERLWLGLAGGVLLLEVAAQELGLHPPWHPTRFASGLLGGWAFVGWLTAVLIRDRDRATREP